MKHISNILLLIFFVLVFISPIVGAEEVKQTDVSSTISEVVIDASLPVSLIGYTVNGDSINQILVLSRDVVVITLNSVPPGFELKAVEERDGIPPREHDEYPVEIKDFSFSQAESIRVHLSLVLASSEEDESDVTENPETPETPAEPENPDNPPVNPDTPGSDEPGSDEPYRPILPPAGSVYNLAGFIPLGAGALLLFLALFWRRKVYRILKSHAKKHGEKPEKEHLKEIADAIIKLVRDEGRYPEWKKNNDVMRRLGVGICELLDEMNYPKIVPREALATEILKAARGRINRHRL
jgi:hypothetical protein